MPIKTTFKPATATRGVVKSMAMRGLLALVTFGLVAIGASLTHASEPISLVPTNTAPNLSIPLTDESSAWLKDKKTLTLGVSRDNFEPYEIIQGKNLKGIVADYLHLIGSSLNLQINVQVYPDRTSLLRALQTNEVDVVGSGMKDDQAYPGLTASIPYVENTPVIVGRGAELEFSKIRVQGNIAYTGTFITPEQIADSLTNVTPVPYASALEALHAIEYRRQRWFVGDPITIGYYKGQGELSHIHTYPLKNAGKNGFSFLFRSEDISLRNLFDLAIESIPAAQAEKIVSYWAADTEIEKAPRINFTAEELKWLASHPEVKVAINSSLPPYSFYDESGELKGVVIDLLSEISQTTGVNFRIIDSPNLGELEHSLRSNDADMALTLLPNNERAQYLRFTEPYLLNSFALITSKTNTIENLKDLSNKKVAIQRSNFVADKLMQYDPAIQVIKKDSQLDSLVAVANGEVDAAITLLPTATYLIRQYFFDDLKVATSLPDFQANLPFSIKSDQSVLYGIMVKVIDRLGPNYVNGLMNNWKATSPSKTSVWQEYISSFRTLSLFAALSSLVLLCLILYLYIKRKHSQLDAERFEFRSSLLDSIPMAISVRDLEGRFVFCNQIFYTQLKVSPEQVIGKLTCEFVGLDRQQAEEHERLYFQALKNGSADQRQLDATVNGIHLTFRQWDRPYTDKNGNIAGLISGYADMTSNVLLLQQLRDAHDRAVQANEAKSRFLAVMSHEIRTPLNAIIGLLELTMQRMDRGDPWDRDDLEVAYGSSKSLIELIDDILDLAKIESGNITLMAQDCNLAQVINSVLRVFSGVARQKGLYLRLDESVAANLSVSLDAGRLKQILSNVLSNAIKFTDTGGIVIQARSRTENHVAKIHIEISDTGIGISEADQAKLFQPFSQANTANHTRGGTGLGLVICRQLAELMGGTLVLHSACGRGTKVIIDLCAPEVESAPPVPISTPEVARNSDRKLKVLLVDDHPANRLLLGQQLEFLGHSVVEAEDGAQAFEFLKAQQFDLVVTDCSMPVMDGYQLTRQWRLHEAQNDLAPRWIMGFTANAQPEERVRCVEAGMDGCLFKPVSLAELQACIESLTPRPTPAEPIDAPQYTEQAPLLDPVSIAGLTNGNEKLTRMLLLQLLSSNKLDLQQLKEKLQDQQWKELSLLAHRLKGVARLINSRPLIEATKDYEEEFNHPTTEEKMRLLAVNICEILEKLQSAISAELDHEKQSTNH